MKEIKFRFVLADEEGKIHYLFKTLKEIEKYGVYMIAPPSNYTVKDRNLYIGKKDKNGREIYEGDKVRYIDSLAHTDWSKFQKIECLAVIGSIREVAWLDSPAICDVKVIDNIYEGEAK